MIVLLSLRLLTCLVILGLLRARLLLILLTIERVICVHGEHLTVEVVVEVIELGSGRYVLGAGSRKAAAWLDLTLPVQFNLPLEATIISHRCIKIQDAANICLRI